MKQDLYPVDETRTASESTPLVKGKDAGSKLPAKRRGYVPVEVVSFLYFFTTFFSNPHTQFYVFDKVSAKYGHVNTTDPLPCEDNFYNSSASEVELKVQTETSTVMMYLLFASTFSGVLPTIFLGSLTDRHGRKIACILAILGSTCKQLIYVVIFNLDANVNYLYIGNVVEGLCGYYGAMLVALFGTIADITEPGKQRAFRITTTEGCLFLASAVAIGASGVWIENSGYLQPLYTMIGISALNMAVVLFILPETRKKTDRPFSLVEPLRIKKKSYVFVIDTPSKRRWKLQLSIAVFFITFSISIAQNTIMTLFLLKSPFCWTMVHITIYAAVAMVVDWVCILFLTRCLGNYLSDVHMALIGTTSTFLSLLIVGLAVNDAMIYAAAAVGLFIELVTPMMRSVMSRLVTNDEQGALFGSISVVEMFSGAVLGLAATAGYTSSVSFFPGLVFIVLSFLMACLSGALIVLSCSLHKTKGKTTVLDLGN
ncbi:LOW QUALITY PROTEIN: proton-coupled folate transporter-like [Haliotis rubra]|uniref:LOW QUALITY PROTEIN: proton-coupled folate transporter-like n=1 Tax=Haliotis rubra TaxID=36100 RepID=UPI001EE62A46|nr:LOW QUALITY PROTEIN: proton-coupled folate transporter-like [Haliotis rubra]